MTTSPPIPIIFLAFANDRQPNGAYLRNLAEEAQRLQDTLRPAEQAGLCQVVTHQNVTIDQVLNTFQETPYRHRIGIFHYGGHANAHQLLLETSQGSIATADAAGFAAFLAQQRGLVMVFLNACSTQPQVQGLLDAGVSLVIATDQAIDDAIATQFAARFYQGFASGSTVQSAFHEAASAIQIQYGTDLRHFYAAGLNPDKQFADRWPWALYQRPGSAIDAGWNLPQAVDNPLFGLPALPALAPPTLPFRYLQGFRRADAPIFFGRGHQIRELYTRVTAIDSEPIILFYGQSGVGKSSLLAAGLLPRLEADHQVRYLVRDQATGLPGTLQAALNITHVTAAAGTADHFSATWHTQEQEKPLTIILDQVEEFYTRPQHDTPGEMDRFLDALIAIFSSLTYRPRGKLLLSFRKEYLADIEARLVTRKLTYSKLFLERLDQRGIIEAVTGITRDPDLQQHYGLTIASSLIAPSLPEIIAQELRADRGAAVAPTLQILLSKLWERAKARNHAHPHFDTDLYADLRAQGLLLDDFLDQQLSTLRQEYPAAVNIGLALDLLAFHTTRLGTAEQHTITELHIAYHDQQTTIDTLVQRCRDLYLLADPVESHSTQEPVTRLAHDTLAPLVRARFDESDLPGQRARRILESRVIDWADDRIGVPLDEDDLVLVETGRTGMRIRSPDEERLVAASISLRNRRRQEERNLEAEREATRARDLANAQTLAREQTSRARTFRRAAIITAILLLIALIVGFIAYDRQRAAVASEATAQAESTRANDARATADINAAIAATRAAEAQAAQATAQAEAANARTQAQIAATRARESIGSQAVAETARGETQQQTRRAKADELAAAAKRELTQKDFDPSLVLLLAVRAVTMTQPSDGPVFVNAFTTLDEVVRLVPPKFRTFRGHTNLVASAIFSSDGKYIVTASYDNTARIWDVEIDEELHQLQGHMDAITSAVFSPDGKLVVTASDDTTARIWDAETGQTLYQLQGHTAAVNSAMFSPDGKLIVTASDDTTARIWDVETGQELHQLQGHTAAVQSAMFSPDGKLIVTASIDKAARIWDTETGQELHHLQGHTAAVQSAMFSPDGKLIVTASDDTTARIWNVETGQTLHQLQGHTGRLRSAVFSPSGKLIVTASIDKAARIWDTETGQTLHQLQGHTAAVGSASFSPDGRYIVTASYDNTVRIWVVETGQELERFQGYSAIFSPNGKRILTTNDGDYTYSTSINIRIWDVETGQTLHQLQSHVDLITSAVFSPDGKYLVTASYDNTARIWDTETGEELHRLQGHTDSVNSAMFSPDGKLIVTASDDTTARIWDVETGQELHQLQSHTDSVNSAAFSSDGKLVVTASYDTTARIWDAETGQELHQLYGHTYWVNSAAFSPDGRYIVTASYDTTARIWDAETGQMLYHYHQLQGHTDYVTSAVFSPDGKYIVTASDDTTARIWDVETGQELHQLQGHTNAINSAVFSPDGRYIVTASDDATARIWDAETGRELHQLQGHMDTVTSASFSPDGKYIITASGDHTARIWNVETGQILYQLQGHTDYVTSASFGPDSKYIVTASTDNTARIWFSSVNHYIEAAQRLIIRNPPSFTAEERTIYGLDE